MVGKLFVSAIVTGMLLASFQAGPVAAQTAPAIFKTNFKTSAVGYDDTLYRGLAFTKNYFIAAMGVNKSLVIRSYDGTLERYVRGVWSPYDYQYTFWGMGAASDNKSVWTTGYWDNTVYEINIQSGEVVQSWLLRDANGQIISSPVHIDYDACTNHLLVTVYNGNNTVYELTRSGTFVKSFQAPGVGTNVSIRSTKGGYFAWHPGRGSNPDSSDGILYFFKRDGTTVWQKPVAWSGFDFSFYNGIFYYDTLVKTDKGIQGGRILQQVIKNLPAGSEMCPLK